MKGYQSRVNDINALEPELAALSDEALKARTAEFRQQLADGKTLDDLLVPAFATVREAAKRTLGQRHFDVQLIGGMVLHEGDIAEMKTGEGKTLVATLAVYLNALAGKGDVALADLRAVNLGENGVVLGANRQAGGQKRSQAARHGQGGQAEAQAGFRFRERGGHGKSLS